MACGPDVRRPFDDVGDEGVERRPGYREIVERDVDDVVARLLGHVRHGTRAVAVVPAVNGRLARALHGDAQPALARPLRVDGEFGRPVSRAAGQAGSAGRHLARVACRRARDAERAARARPAHRLAAKRHAQPVLAHLGGREIDHVALGHGHHVRGYRAARRACDHHRERRPARVPSHHTELLQTVDRCHCRVAHESRTLLCVSDDG